MFLFRVSPQEARHALRNRDGHPSLAGLVLSPEGEVSLLGFGEWSIKKEHTYRRAIVRGDSFPQDGEAGRWLKKIIGKDFPSNHHCWVLQSGGQELNVMWSDSHVTIGRITVKDW